MGGPRRDGQKRRDELLDAALSCFERGILGTGIEEIRRAAGASPSSVYHHFDGLNGVVVALLERTFERLFAHLVKKVSASTDARSAVVALVEGHLEWVLRHRREARFMYEATALELGSAARDGLAAHKLAMLAPLVEHLAPFIADGSLPQWTVPELDVVLLGPSHEACRRLLAGADFDPAWMKRELPMAAWKSVAPAVISRAAPARSPAGRRS